MSNSRIFATHAPAYWAAGISVIPLIPAQKRPAIMAWQRFSEEMPDDGTRAGWLAEHAHGNIGLVLGQQSGIVILDVDTDDPAVHHLVESVLPLSPWRRFGKKGFAAAYKFNGERTFRIKKADEGGVMELLASKTQMVLPPSIHPDTQQPYRANCDLLSVLDRLPSLPRDVEVLLREGLKELGYELSHGGFTKITDWVAPGARDNRLIQVAGMYANAILRGEVSFMEAVHQMRGWSESRVARVAGDEVDVEKGIQRMAEFLISDVTGEKRRMLPPGWDADLPAATRKSLGLEILGIDNVDLTPEQMRTQLEAILANLPPDDIRRVDEVNKALDRLARSNSRDALTEEHLLRWISETSMTGITLSSLKRRLKELRNGEIAGLDHNEIATKALADLDRFGEVRFQHGRFYQWSGSHWAVKDEDEIFRHIADAYGSLPAARKANDHMGILKTMGRKAARSLTDHAIPGVNFANGYLTLDGTLMPHNPGFGATYTLPYRYLPELADRCAQWLEFLYSRWADDEDRDYKIVALQEAICATLLGFAPRLQRAFLLIGVARSGKSQVLKVMRGLLPNEAICNIPPEAWGDKFMPAEFSGKLLNVAGELSETKLISGDRFKQIVEGDEISVQRKGKDPFDLRPVCAHWFASNFLPRSRDTSEGFTRRWLILQFNSQVQLGDVRLDFGDALIADEREAIAAWALQARTRLLAQQSYTLPPSHVKAVEEMADANDSVRFFMARARAIRIVPPQAGKTPCRMSSTAIYGEYYRFCAEAGDARPVGLKTFLARMRGLEASMGFKVVVVESDGRQETFYENIMSAA